MVEKKEDVGDETLTCVGIIAAPHGVRGQFFLRSYTAVPKDIVSYGALYNKLHTKIFDITLHGPKKDGFIASMPDVKNREDAGKLRGTKLYVPKSSLPELDEEEFYHTDLVGLKVKHEESGELFGLVKAVQNFGTDDVVEVQFADSTKSEYFLFTKAIFPHIYISEGYMTIVPPEEIIAKED